MEDAIVRWSTNTGPKIWKNEQPKNKIEVSYIIIVIIFVRFLIFDVRGVDS